MMGWGVSGVATWGVIWRGWGRGGAALAARRAGRRALASTPSTADTRGRMRSLRMDSGWSCTEEGETKSPGRAASTLLIRFLRDMG
jgi:hypothetical protein